MPDRVRIFVGFNVAEGDDFQRGELKRAIEAEHDRIDGRVVERVRTALAPEQAGAHATGTMNDLNIIFGKPVSVQVERDAAENSRHGDEHPLFPCHTRRFFTPRKWKYSRVTKENRSEEHT